MCKCIHLTTQSLLIIPHPMNVLFHGKNPMKSLNKLATRTAHNPIPLSAFKLIQFNFNILHTCLVFARMITAFFHCSTFIFIIIYLFLFQLVLIKDGNKLDCCDKFASPHPSKIAAFGNTIITSGPVSNVIK